MNDLPTLAYLTADLPGIGGVIKKRPEDFLVEEIPLYDPSGEGEHLYLFVEKKGMTTGEAVQLLARHFHVSHREISYAGMKDKVAITRQHFSIRLPNKSRDELARDLSPLGMTCHWALRHGNKLRRGHLIGNRFAIRIRDVEPSLVVRAKRTLDRLLKVGVPNYLGAQRFGYRGDNHELGRLLLQKKWDEFLRQMLGGPRASESQDLQEARAAFDRGEITRALEFWPRRLRHERQALDALRQGRSLEQAVRAIAAMQLDFLVTAAQSAVFNAALHHRITNASGPGIGRLIEGDLAYKHDNGAVFAVDASTAEKENAADGRASLFEVSPSGPMWGSGMTKPAGAVLEWEQAALASVGLSESDFVEGSLVPGGARRSMRVRITDADISGGVDEHGAYVRLAFDLPRGAFATTVLREVMKSDAHQTDDPAEDDHG